MDGSKRSGDKYSSEKTYRGSKPKGGDSSRSTDTREQSSTSSRSQESHWDDVTRHPQAFTSSRAGEITSSSSAWPAASEIGDSGYSRPIAPYPDTTSSSAYTSYSSEHTSTTPYYPNTMEATSSSAYPSYGSEHISTAPYYPNTMEATSSSAYPSYGSEHISTAPYPDTTSSSAYPSYGSEHISTAPYYPNTMEATSSSAYPSYGSERTSIAPYPDTMSSRIGNDSSRYETRESMRAQTGGDPSVVQQHQILMRSEAYRRLDTVANSTGQQLILRDSSRLPDRPVKYDVGLHEISVPMSHADGTARPLADVRADIVWEMHNACNKDMLEKLDRLDPPDPGPSASQADREKYSYNKAVYALATEWYEWSLVRESQMRIQMINKDVTKTMGNNRGGEHVKTKNADLVKSWNQFDNYIGGQVHGGHTARYDPSAVNANWIGVQILAKVDADRRGHDALRVRESVVTDWLQGNRPNIKNPEKNPFISLSTY